MPLTFWICWLLFTESSHLHPPALAPVLFFYPILYFSCCILLAACLLSLLLLFFFLNKMFRKNCRAFYLENFFWLFIFFRAYFCFLFYFHPCRGSVTCVLGQVWHSKPEKETEAGGRRERRTDSRLLTHIHIFTCNRKQKPQLNFSFSFDFPAAFLYFSFFLSLSLRAS